MEKVNVRVVGNSSDLHQFIVLLASWAEITRREFEVWSAVTTISMSLSLFLNVSCDAAVSILCMLLCKSLSNETSLIARGITVGAHRRYYYLICCCCCWKMMAIIKLAPHEQGFPTGYRGIHLMIMAINIVLHPSRGQSQG